MSWTAGQGRVAAAIALAAVLIGAVVLPLERLNPALFDLYQRWRPREAERLPVVIVAVDETSLRELGQWPWPRTLTAGLLERIKASGPVAIGLDVLMVEPDRLSAENVLSHHPNVGSELREALARLPASDQLLAEAIAGSVPVVVGNGGLEDAGGAAEPAPILTPFRVIGEGGLDVVPEYQRILRNVPEIERAAAGHGLLNAQLDADGIVRRMPLLARQDSRLYPSLALELLRVAQRAATFAVHTDPDGVRAVQVGELTIPTDPGGRIALYFSPSDPRRYVSAHEVLGAGVARERLEHKLVLLGVTGLGLIDAPATPVASRMDGVEVHAQLLENLLYQAQLSRPNWAGRAELGLALALGLALIALLPRLGWGPGLGLGLGLLGLSVSGSALAFVQRGWLLDPLPAALCLLAVYVVLNGTRMARLDRARRELAGQLQVERLASAKMAGELGAARHIQRGILPDPSSFRLPPGASLHAYLEPASAVGGDLYDFVWLDAERLFVILGDVSGKGVPASLFMAISKTLCKSAALRERAGVGAILTQANREISRENTALLFVTVAAVIIDTRDGGLEVALAGHEPPLVARPGQPPRRIEVDAGPPLCAIDDYTYAATADRLAPGETLLLVTDGVTEAMDGDGRLYGAERLREALAAVTPGEDAAAVGERVRHAVEGFVRSAPASDDIALLTFRLAPAPGPGNGGGNAGGG